MQATQIFFPERNKVALETVALPPLGAHDVLVRTEVSLISAGTELTNLLGDMKGQPFPKYPGYSNVGVVEAVGDQVGFYSWRPCAEQRQTRLPPHSQPRDQAHRRAANLTPRA